MHFKTSLISISLGLVLVAFAEELKPTPDTQDLPKNQPSTGDAIHQVKTWIDSFRNKDETYVLSAMKDMKITRSTWSFKGHEELLIIGSNTDSKSSFYFYDKRVVKAALHFLSE